MLEIRLRGHAFRFSPPHSERIATAALILAVAIPMLLIWIWI